MSLQQIHALIKSRDYDAALRELERGEGSIVALIDKQLLAYCQLKARVPLPGESAPAAARTPEAWSYISHGGRPGLDLQSMRIACGVDIQACGAATQTAAVRHLIVDENPSCLDLFRTGQVGAGDIVVQLVGDSPQDNPGRYHTISWLRKLGLNVYGLATRSQVPTDGDLILPPTALAGLRKRRSVIEGFAAANGLVPERCFREAMLRIQHLDIGFLDSGLIIARIRENIRRDKLLENSGAQDDDMQQAPFPSGVCELYLRNKYYNARGVYEPDTRKVLEYYAGRRIHPNYFSELADDELGRFRADPKGFLRSGSTAVFLDPTCYDQHSGISSYLVNLYKFFKMSRLVEQTLIIKNPFSSSQANNRQLFREHVAALFNDHQEFSGAMVFFDSEAHYPGILLDGRFQKICTTHCSSILAAKFDHKLPSPIPKSLIAIMKSEKANIDSARLVVTPTVNHDVVQQALYREHVPDYEAYIPKPLVNYIHDEYLDFIPFAEREFDLLFLGRPQVLKGFDVLLDLAANSPQLKFAIVTNGENELTEKFKALANTTVYLNLDKSETYERLRNAKSFIDLSVHHNCSTVLLEAINAKTPGVLRQMNTYDEILGREELSNLYLFLSDDDINDKNRAITMIVAHLSELERLSESSDSDFLFNRFLLENYVQHYKFYKQIFTEWTISRKTYRTSALYNNYLSGKRVVNVVHSPSLADGDGRFIDSFDLIARFNRSLEKVTPEKQGSRTDILYSCINRSPDSGNMTKETYQSVIEPSGAWLCKAYPNLDWKGYFSFNQDHRAGATYDNYAFETFNHAPQRSSEFAVEWYKIIEANIKSRPNTGILAILDLIQYDVNSLFLKGYTFFKGGYDKSYRNQNEDDVLNYMKQLGNHNQQRQNLFARKILLTESAIQFDEGLRAILDSM